MKAGDLVLFDHGNIHTDDRIIGTVFKVHEYYVTLITAKERRKKVLSFHCKPITEKEAFKLRLEGVK